MKTIFSLLCLLLLLPLGSDAQRADTAKLPAAAVDTPARTVIPRKAADTTLKRATTQYKSNIVIQKQLKTNSNTPQQKIPINKVQPRKTPATKPRIKPTPVPRSRTKPKPTSRSSDN